MNSLPDFDAKYTRDHPTYDHMPVVPGDHVPTNRRILLSFNLKVLAPAVLALFLIWAFFTNHAPAFVRSDLLQNRLFFLAGLALGVCDYLLFRKRGEHDATPMWKRVVLSIEILSVAVLLVFFLWNNSAFASLGAGSAAGLLVGSAIVAYRRNFALP